MSKAAKDKHIAICCNVDKFPHEPHSTDNPLVVCEGDIILLNKDYTAGIMQGARDVGHAIKVGFCNRCFEDYNIADIIKKEVANILGNPETHKQLLPDYNWLKKSYGVKGDDYPLMKHSVTCMNADHAVAHGEEHLGQTHDIIIRGMFRMMAGEFTTWVDHQPYAYWGEFDACLHCLDYQLNLIEQMAIMRFYGFIAGQDLHENPDKQMPMSWVNAMAGAKLRTE